MTKMGRVRVAGRGFGNGEVRALGLADEETVMKMGSGG